jgi:membrane-associated phospholipid phosphatase
MASIAAGGLSGGVVPYLFDHSMRFSGVGLPLGIVIGLMFYLTLKLPSRDERRVADRLPRLILAALLAAIVAHFVEIQVGMATVSTELYLAVYAALAVGGTVEESIAPVNPDDEEYPQSSAPLSHAAMAGLLLIVLTYAFSLPSLNPHAPGFALFWLYAGVWVAGLLLMMSDVSMLQGPAPQRAEAVRDYVRISLLLWMPFAVLHIAWVHWRPGAATSPLETLRELAAHMSNTASTFYLCVLSIVSGAALVGAGRDVAGGTVCRRPPYFAVLYALLLIGSVATIVVTNLDRARADAFARIGDTFEHAQRWREARGAYDAALLLLPGEAMYAARRARGVQEEAASAKPSQELTQ